MLVQVSIKVKWLPSVSTKIDVAGVETYRMTVIDHH
jgi:hypothetical protein